MPISNIPRSEIRDLETKFRALPFPNNLRQARPLTISTTISVLVETDNSNNDNTVGITWSYDIDHDSIEEAIELNPLMSSYFQDIRTRTDELNTIIQHLSSKYSVQKREIWRYLNALSTP